MDELTCDRWEGDSKVADKEKCYLDTKMEQTFWPA